MSHPTLPILPQAHQCLLSLPRAHTLLPTLPMSRPLSLCSRCLISAYLHTASTLPILPLSRTRLPFFPLSHSPLPIFTLSHLCLPLSYAPLYLSTWTISNPSSPWSTSLPMCTLLHATSPPTYLFGKLAPPHLSLSPFWLNELSSSSPHPSLHIRTTPDPPWSLSRSRLTQLCLSPRGPYVYLPSTHPSTAPQPSLSSSSLTNYLHTS